MARPRGRTVVPRREIPLTPLPRPASQEPPPTPNRVDIDARCASLRELLYESEKSCQWLSSAVNTPELPAGAWIYVDALRLAVLAAMRNAQLLQLKVRELLPDQPAAPKG